MPRFHAHVSEAAVVVHAHPAADAHSTSGALPAQSSGRWHEHVLQGGPSDCGLRIRHRHDGDGSHDHDAAIAAGPEELLLLPLQPKGWRLLFPAWRRPHPWWHLWPLPEMRLSHAKAHFNSSGVDDLWPGALTVLTQGTKIALGAAAWFWGRNEDAARFYGYAGYAMAATAAVLAGCWLWFWRQSPVCVLLTLANYALYINGWVLSVLSLYDRLEATYNLPARLALLPVLGPPSYITLRTLLFMPSQNRRRRFLLAALSNRSVPLEMNLHVVGPAETRRSHGFLTMLNSYAMVVTLGSKAVVFSLSGKDMGAGEAVAHAAHVLSTVWASLFAIRCRQLALDCYEEAEEAAHGAAPAVVGRGAEG